MTILFRFILGAILAGGLALWTHLDFPLNAIFTLVIGVMSAVWGDKFIMGLLSTMRYFR